MHLLQRSLFVPLRFGILTQSSVFRLSKSLRINSARTMSIYGKLPKIENLEKKLQRKDKMPPTSNLIYNNPFSRWIEFIFHFQKFVFIAISTFTIYTISLYLSNNIELPYVYSDLIIIRNMKEFYVFTGLILSLITVSIFACKFSVLRIYFDKAEKVNKAILCGHLPFLRKIITIKPKSVSPVIRRFPTKDFRTFEYKVDGRKIFLHEDYFRTPANLHRMLTYLH